MTVEAPEPSLDPEGRKKEKLRGNICRNCAAEVSTRFCPHCGQENTEPDLSLKAVLHEFFAELLYYDSKVWRTVRTLVAHPGRLSLEWSAGRRARFLSPVRLYLTITFLFFLSAAWHKPHGMIIQTGDDAKSHQALIKELATSNLSPLERYVSEQQEPQLYLSSSEDKDYKTALDEGSRNYAEAVKNGKIKPSNGWIEHQVEKLEIKAATDPSGLTERYVSEIPKVLFVVLPLLALALKFLYWRQHRTFVEHLVFLLHFHSFAFLVLLPFNLFSTKLSGVAAPIIVLFWIPAYAFIAMLRFYKQPWFLTLLKSWILGFFYVVLSAAGALLALVFVVASLDEAKSPVKNSDSTVQSSLTQSAHPLQAPH